MLQHSRFRQATASQARFSGAYIRDSDFTQAELTAASFVRSTVIQSDFSNAKLHGANLAGVLFQKCKMVGVDFTKCRAWRMWVVGCDCTGAVFDRATVRGSAFHGCDFSNCTFRDADFERAQILNCMYDRTALAEARLENASISASGQMQSVFICHAGEDKPFVRQIAGDLRASGIEVWLDEWQIRVGDSITERVDDALSRVDYVVVVLSQSLFGKPWPMRELRSVLMRQASENQSCILPLRIDDSNLPPLIQDIAYADFRGEYDIGFEQLAESIITGFYG